MVTTNKDTADLKRYNCEILAFLASTRFHDLFARFTVK